MTPFRPWTDLDDKLLRQARKEGASPYQACKILDRPEASVMRRAIALKVPLEK